ncbi:MAG: type II toxin-antitoxin system PemK/MazF family toxin [Thermoanaerobaculia bacterium]
MKRLPSQPHLRRGYRPPRRGEIYRVALDPTIGSEIRKTRPAVVVPNDSCNRYGARVVVLPITSHVESLYPGEARVRVGAKPGRALGDQIRSIDKRRLRARIGTLSDTELTDVDDALRVTLGLSFV